ncbi:MAG: response regulator, partial [Pseudomonadota bacterium]
NHVNQMVMRAFLETEGHQVTIVGSGKDALKEVDKIDFDLIFMDVQMPEMDGLTATQHIRHRGDKKSAIPIIAFTANAMAGDQEEYLASGMSDYLAKPIDMTKLKEIVRKYSDRAAISTAKLVNE